MSETENPANRRSVKNIIVSPRQQLRYSFVLVIGSCVTLALFVGVLIFQINQTITTLGVAYNLDAEVIEAIQNSLNSALWMAMILAALSILSSLALSVRLSHKVYGPVVAIKRYLETLMAGNYQARLSLRQGDDLLDLRDALNQLAETLEKRHTR